MVIFMQLGTAMFNVGCTSKKNTQANLIMKLFETAIGCLAFWLIGYGIAFGDVKLFIGTNGNYYASSGFENIELD